MEKEINRLLGILSKTDPATEGYSMILANLYNVIRLKDSLVAVPETEPEQESFQAKPVAEPAVEEPVVEPIKEVEFIDVRAKLAEAAQRGILIPPILEKYVPEGVTRNLSGVPKERYVELLLEVDALIKAGEKNA